MLYSLLYQTSEVRLVHFSKNYKSLKAKERLFVFIFAFVASWSFWARFSFIELIFFTIFFSFRFARRRV